MPGLTIVTRSVRLLPGPARAPDAPVEVVDRERAGGEHLQRRVAEARDHGDPRRAAGRDHDPVDVDLVLLLVQRRVHALDPGARPHRLRRAAAAARPPTRGCRWARAGPRAAAARRRPPARRRRSSTPKPVSGSQPGRRTSRARQPHGLDHLVGLELRARGADPGQRGRDHRRGEARAVERLVAVLAPSPSSAFGTAVRMPDAGRAEVDRVVGVREPRAGVVGRGRRDGDHVRQRGRELERVAARRTRCRRRPRG